MHDKNINRFDLSIHAIKRDHTHDLFIRPITPIHSGESVEDAEKRMVSTPGRLRNGFDR